MYTLQRNGELFEVCEEESSSTVEVWDCARRSGDAGSVGTARRVSYAQWKQFVETGRWTGPRPSEAVAASWKRCRDMEIDPAPRSCWDFTPLDQLEPFAATLRDLAKDTEKKTYQAIRGRNLLMTMSDAKARLVRTCGDLETLRAADKLNFGPGANWSETSVGTNAIAISLATGSPIQVFGEEHYCRSHHAWTCSAAPILDPRGAIWGCFDISGPVDGDHALAFDLVISAARAVERSLFQAYLQELEDKSRTILSTVFNSVLTGVLSVDAKGHITNANSAAEALLGQSMPSLRGRRIEAFVDYTPFLAARAREASSAEAVTVPCRINPRLIARVAPVFSQSEGLYHSIVTISEPQRIHPMSPSSPKPLPAVSGKDPFAAILGRSPAMTAVIHKARQAARTPSTVLLYGESGTGKELFARGIHAASARAAGPFVAVNCGALARELAQSELFGYRQGAFTGAADKGRLGKFEQADKGTLFLDEISEMPLELQVNLLRPLEERCVVRVGGLRCRPVDVKLIVATNRNLTEQVTAGLFREDLYFRINVVRIAIPPLRERGDADVRLLAEHHARRLCADFGLPFKGIDAPALALLYAHHWPGNVRELLNCVEYAVNAMEGGWIRPEHLPPLVREAQQPRRRTRPATPIEGFRLESVEVETIRDALAHYDGNVSQAARSLGIGRNTLYAKMRKFGIS